MTNKKISITNLDDKKIVVINSIIFKGKRKIKWNDVEEYLKKYVGDSYKIDSSEDIVYIGSEFPDEYTHSNYTKILKGANAKAKANAVQGIPQLIQIATKKSFKSNQKAKHKMDAGLG